MKQILLIAVACVCCVALSSCCGIIYVTKKDIVQMLKDQEATTCRPCHYSARAKTIAHVGSVPVPYFPLRGDISFGPDGPLSGELHALGQGARFRLDSVRVSFGRGNDDEVSKTIKTRLNEFVQDALVGQVPKLYELYGDSTFGRFRVVVSRLNRILVFKGNNYVQLGYKGKLYLRKFSMEKGRYLFYMKVDRYRYVSGYGYMPTQVWVRVVGKDERFNFKGRLRDICVTEGVADYDVELEEEFSSIEW